MNILQNKYTPYDLASFEYKLLPEIFIAHDFHIDNIEKIEHMYDYAISQENTPEMLCDILQTCLDLEDCCQGLMAYAEMLSEMCPESDTITLRRYLDGDNSVYVEANLLDEYLS